MADHAGDGVRVRATKARRAKRAAPATTARAVNRVRARRAVSQHGDSVRATGPISAIDDRGPASKKAYVFALMNFLSFYCFVFFVCVIQEGGEQGAIEGQGQEGERPRRGGPPRRFYARNYRRPQRRPRSQEGGGTSGGEGESLGQAPRTRPAYPPRRRRSSRPNRPSQSEGGEVKSGKVFIFLFYFFKKNDIIKT